MNTGFDFNLPNDKRSAFRSPMVHAGGFSKHVDRELLLEQMYGRVMYRQALEAYAYIYDAALHSASEADKALKLELAEETLRNLLRMYLEAHGGPGNSVHCE